MGRVMFFYESTKIHDQAEARSNCEVGLHGVFTPIGTSTSSATPAPSAAAAAPRDLTPSEAAKLQKANDKLNEQLKH
jgi:hypothetical protein